MDLRDVGRSSLYANLRQYTNAQGSIPSGVRVAGIEQDQTTPFSSAFHMSVGADWGGYFHQEIISVAKRHGWDYHNIHNFFFLFPIVSNGCAHGYLGDRSDVLALTMAYALWCLETNGLAHTDIAGDNVVIVNYKHIELIDLEGLYIQGAPPVAQPSKGWAGYQHPRLDGQGQSYLQGDRFAGAIILVEILTWWNPLIRALTDGESLFQFKHPNARDEMTQRLRGVRQILRGMYPGLYELFEQAWYSPNLARCPDFRTWVMCILRLRWDG